MRCTEQNVHRVAVGMICQNLHLLGRGRSGYETGEDHPIRRNAFDELEKFIPTMFCILHNWHEKLCFSGIFFKRALSDARSPLEMGSCWCLFYGELISLTVNLVYICQVSNSPWRVTNSMFMYSISSRRAGKEDEDADEDADGEGRGYGQGRTKKQTGTRTGKKTRTRIRMRILRWA